jgi:arabinan endo-1,5-alpha-L-arabinosidase
MRWISALSLLSAMLVPALLAGCIASDASVRTFAQPGYVNPVLDADFPDPALLRAGDGYHYAYATQGERNGAMVNIQVARSRDLTRWEHLGDALPVKPGWARRTQDFWAPHVSEHDGRYYLYYSAKPDAALDDDKRGLCLAVATAAKPEGPFTDSGRPLQCGSGFVDIDPMAFDDPRTGKRLLYWGSGFGPIKVQELSADRLSFAPGSRPADLIRPVPDSDAANHQRLIEGAWVIHRAPWYFLFYSGDNCCGPNAHYAVMVARSRRAEGPYETLAAATGASTSVILDRRGTWVAPGHNSVVTDAKGADWIVYHAVDTRRPRSKPSDEVNTRRVMLIDRLVYRNGWPRIEGDGPSTGSRPAPAPHR